MSTPMSQKITLEEITLRKKKLQEELHLQKEAIVATTHELFAPVAPAPNKASALMRSFNTGMAIFDGALIGIKIIRGLRKLFKKSK